MKCDMWCFPFEWFVLFSVAGDIFLIQWMIVEECETFLKRTAFFWSQLNDFMKMVTLNRLWTMNFVAKSMRNIFLNKLFHKCYQIETQFDSTSAYLYFTKCALQLENKVHGLLMKWKRMLLILFEKIHECSYCLFFKRSDVCMLCWYWMNVKRMNISNLRYLLTLSG